jgi:hypothetical protein
VYTLFSDIAGWFRAKSRPGETSEPVPVK